MRPFALLATIVTCAVGAPPVLASPSAAGVVASPALETAVLDGLNAARAKAGLGPLRPAPGLDDAAAAHGRAMVHGGFFAHESAGGTPSWLRISRFYAPTPVWRVGENLLWRAGHVRPGQVVRTWLESAPHRINLLSPAWREVGVSVIRATRAPGVYGGRAATVVVADFGAR